MAPPEVQSTDPAAAPQHPHDHAGSRMSRSRARLRACATAYDSIVVQQISLLNVVEGFLERQRSCSIPTRSSYASKVVPCMAPLETFPHRQLLENLLRTANPVDTAE